MKITIAKTAGFCFGVRNALKIAEQTAERKGKIYTYGSLIHNRDVIRRLEERQIYAVEDPEALPEGAAVVIRAHGAPRSVYEELSQRGIEIVDATCPYVKKIHTIVQERGQQGDAIIILWDPAHPEVQGTKGWCLEEPWIFEDLESVQNHLPPKNKRYTLVAQTTFDQYKFAKIVEFFQKMEYNLNMCPTICTATAQHQSEALQLAKESDAVIVIGGKHSSNTRKLYNLCLSQCENTF